MRKIGIPKSQTQSSIYTHQHNKLLFFMYSNSLFDMLTHWQETVACVKYNSYEMQRYSIELFFTHFKLLQQAIISLKILPVTSPHFLQKFLWCCKCSNKLGNPSVWDSSYGDTKDVYDRVSYSCFPLRGPCFASIWTLRALMSCLTAEA